MIEIIFIAVLVIAVLIGAISGLVKGYAKTSFLGGSVLLTLLLERVIGGSVKKDSGGFAIAIMIATVASLLVFSLLSALLRKFVNGKVEARRTLSKYENYDELEENQTRILNAIDNDDKATYKRLRKERKKIKTKSGGWGVVSRITGSVAGMLNWFVGAFVLIAFITMFADLSKISPLTNVFESFLSSDLWVKTLGAIAMDTIVISLLSLAIRSGYKSGISSVLSFVIIIGLIVACGFASYNLAASEAMSGMVNGLEEGILSALPEALEGMKHMLAVIITTAILFVLSLIVIIIIAIFLPKFVDKFRENKVFGAIDGVFGAIVFTAFIFALLLVFGGVAYTLNDLPVMDRLNFYMDKSFFADCLYSCNPMASVFENLPIRSWFGGNTAQ